MKKIIVVVLALIIPHFLVAGLRDMIVLIDWHNESVFNTLKTEKPIYNIGESSGFGPVTSALITALGQKVCPILVSSATWKNFVERRKIFSDFYLLDVPSLVEKYKGITYPRFNTEQGIANFSVLCKNVSKNIEKKESFELQELFGFLIPYAATIDVNDWILQKPTPHWYLLVPKNYIKKIQQEKLPKISENLAKKLSESEIILGLKQNAPLENPFDPAQHESKLSIGYQEEFFQALKNCFITINDMTVKDKPEETEKNRAWYLHHWFFYSIGHGSPSDLFFSGIIAGLTVSQFQKLLTFFDRKIYTDFLFYSTCFAGGHHLKKPYIKEWFYPPLEPTKAERKAIRAESFNYIISAETLVYAATFGYTPAISIPFYVGVSGLFYQQQFDNFFNGLHAYVWPPVLTITEMLKATATRKKNYFKNLSYILNHVALFLDKQGNIEPSMQIPVVRYPGTGWFSVINVEEKILNITKVLMEVRSAENKPIKAIDKQVIIIHAGSPVTERMIDEKYHSELLAPLILKKQKLQKPLTILSYAPGSAMHYFAKIDARTLGFFELLRAFLPPIDEYYSRTYFIKKLICKNDIVSVKQNSPLGMYLGGGIELNNVIIVYNGQNPTDPLDPRRVHGIFFVHEDQKFRSLWEPHDIQSIQRFKKNEFPSLQKIVDHDFKIPEYPQQFVDNFNQRIVETKSIITIQQRKIEEQKKRSSLLKGLSEQLVFLTQALRELNQQMMVLNEN
jgi:hypothetical protein